MCAPTWKKSTQGIQDIPLHTRHTTKIALRAYKTYHYIQDIPQKKQSRHTRHTTTYKTYHKNSTQGIQDIPPLTFRTEPARACAKLAPNPKSGYMRPAHTNVRVYVQYTPRMQTFCSMRQIDSRPKEGVHEACTHTHTHTHKCTCMFGTRHACKHFVACAKLTPDPKRGCMRPAHTLHHAHISHTRHTHTKGLQPALDCISASRVAHKRAHASCTHMLTCTLGTRHTREDATHGIHTQRTYTRHAREDATHDMHMKMLHTAYT